MMRWEKQNARSDGLDDAQRAISSTVEFSIFFLMRSWFLEGARWEWEDRKFAAGSWIGWRMVSGDDLGASGLYIPGVRST